MNLGDLMPHNFKYYYFCVGQQKKMQINLTQSIN